MSWCLSMLPFPTPERRVTDDMPTTFLGDVTALGWPPAGLVRPLACRMISPVRRGLL
jgi:hypothetical protein